MQSRYLFAIGVLAGMAAAAGAQQQRSTMGPPVRTGLPGFSKTVPNQRNILPSQGVDYGDYHLNSGWGWYGPGWSYTGINVNGNGWSLYTNNGLANQLAGNQYVGNRSGHGGHDTGCIVVPDANDVLPNLPSWWRDRAHVLHGGDYGWDYDVICFPEWNGNSWVYVPVGYGYGWYPSGYTYVNGQVTMNETAGWGTFSNPQPSQAQAQPAVEVPPPTPLEVARIGLLIGDLASAEAQYRAHLKDNTEDSVALREFGLVMLEADRVDEGFAAMRKAYRDRPELVGQPLNLAALGFDGARTRTLMGVVSPQANQLKTASAWLTLAVLLQAQEKDGAALRMIKKADEVGLDQSIADPFRTQLTR